jgi:hypothetical protein
MNYGYDKTTKGWIESKKIQLAESLSRKLKIPIGFAFGKPYIEIDQLYSGVRIRKITHLSESEQEALVKNADKIYLEVMKKNDLNST